MNSKARFNLALIWHTTSNYIHHCNLKIPSMKVLPFCNCMYIDFWFCGWLLKSKLHVYIPYVRYISWSKVWFTVHVFLSCRYVATGNNRSVKMHRSISSSDVKEYSTGARVKDVQLEEEDIEYRWGHLYHSSGSATVKLAKSGHRFSGRHEHYQQAH